MTRGPQDRHEIATAVRPWISEKELVGAPKVRNELKESRFHDGPSGLEFHSDT
jgi:hypothetical protein